MIWRWSLALAPAVRIASGTPWRSTSRVCFVPVRLRSTGLGPVASPPPKARTVTLSMIAVSGSSFPSFGSSRSSSAWSRSQMPASSQAEPAMGRPAGAAEFLRDILPAGAGREYEPDHSQDDPVPDPGPSPLRADGLLRWQVMGDDLEEFFRHLCSGHRWSLLSKVTTDGWRRIRCQFKVLSEFLMTSIARTVGTASLTLRRVIQT